MNLWTFQRMGKFHLGWHKYLKYVFSNIVFWFLLKVQLVFSLKQSLWNKLRDMWTKIDQHWLIEMVSKCQYMCLKAAFKSAVHLQVLYMSGQTFRATPDSDLLFRLKLSVSWNISRAIFLLVSVLCWPAAPRQRCWLPCSLKNVTHQWSRPTANRCQFSYEYLREYLIALQLTARYLIYQIQQYIFNHGNSLTLNTWTRNTYCTAVTLTGFHYVVNDYDNMYGRWLGDWTAAHTDVT